jgi:hypothetical protein
MTAAKRAKLRRAIASIPIAARVAISLLVLFAVSMLTGWFALEEEASTPAALLFLVAGLSSFGLLGTSAWIGASWVIHSESRRTPETAREAADRLDAIAWKEIIGAIGTLISVVMLVVGIVRGISGMWELMTDSWEQLPRKYTQFAPICKYVTFEPFRREPAGANDRVEIGFDGSTFAAGPSNRPIVLALKNVANGPHALRVKTTLDNREDTFESTVKIIDVADFYYFDVVDRTPSVGLIQSSLVLQKLERAGVALPVCSTLPAGASVAN